MSDQLRRQGRKQPLDLSFFRELRYARVLLQYRADDELELPAFAGSTIRGSLGRVLRERLCEARPRCVQTCLHPDSCDYYRLFEQNRSRSEATKGRNIHKPYVLAVQIPQELEDICYGAPARDPYTVLPPAAGEGVPRLANDCKLALPSGAPFRVTLTLFGQLTAIMPAVLDLLVERPLRLGGGHMILNQIADTLQGGRILYDARLPGFPPGTARTDSLAFLLDPPPATPSRMRLCLKTPTRFKDEKEFCFRASGLARHLLERALARAKNIFDSFCSPPNTRLPWMELPPHSLAVEDYRLYHYVFPRVSFRQDQRMNFDGLVGYIDLRGRLDGLLPLARSTEFLHFGEEVTFGLGQVECWFQ